MWHWLTKDHPGAFGLVFLASLAGIGLMGMAALFLLSRQDLLPPPPITNTTCIDSKLEFLHRRDLKAIEMLAVGSSVTERNLDFRAISDARPDLAALNAAPCYLSMNQTAFLGEFLVERLPRTRILLTVIAPRDFEHCSTNQTDFFETGLVNRYVIEKKPAPLLYFRNFRLKLFIKAVQGQIEMREDPLKVTPIDAYGSVPLHIKSDYFQPAALEASCFDALRRLARIADQKNVWLIVAALPFNPEWQSRFDPDGAVTAAFRQGLREALKGSKAVMIDDTAFKIPPDHFSDMVHLYWPKTPAYSRFLAAQMPAGRPNDPQISTN